jgi:hypothetical protein
MDKVLRRVDEVHGVAAAEDAAACRKGGKGRRKMERRLWQRRGLGWEGGEAKTGKEVGGCASLPGSVAGDDNNEGASNGDGPPRWPLQLTQDDMHRAPLSMMVSVLQPEFDRHYDSALFSPSPPPPARRRRQTPDPLAHALWWLARPTFVLAGFFQLSMVVAQVLVPMFMWRLLRLLEESDGGGGGGSRTSVFRGALPYILLILVADTANAYGMHWQRFLAMSSGVGMRAAVAGAMYERALTLTPGGRAGLTTGVVSNLLATDAQKLYEVVAEGHLLWSAPLSMLLMAIMLMAVVGPGMAMGIALAGHPIFIICKGDRPVWC